MNPHLIKALVLLAVVTGLFGAGFKAGGDSERAAQLTVLEEKVAEFQKAQKALDDEYQVKLAAKESYYATRAAREQKIKIVWRTKNEIIYRDRKRNNVLCYDDKRMQRQTERTNDTNKALREAFGTHAATAAAQPAD